MGEEETMAKEQESASAEGEQTYSGEKKGERYSGTKRRRETVLVVSRVNRTFELHLRNATYTFPPYGRHEMSRAEVESDEFKRQRDKLLVKE
jgi:hypothetical protein